MNEPSLLLPKLPQICSVEADTGQGGYALWGIKGREKGPVWGERERERGRERKREEWRRGRYGGGVGKEGEREILLISEDEEKVGWIA